MESVTATPMTNEQFQQRYCGLQDYLAASSVRNGYLVVDDSDGSTTWMSESDFEARYKREDGPC